MAISQYTRYENRMDVSSPETIGDAQKVSDFFDENPYDDDFEVKLSQVNKSIISEEKKGDSDDSNNGNGEESDFLIRQEKLSGKDINNLALMPTRPPLSESTVEKEKTVKDPPEYIERGSELSTSETSSKRHSIQKTVERIITTATVVDAMGDIISGGASAVAQPNRIRIDEVLSQTSIVSKESHHDIRSLDEVIDELGLETCRSNDDSIKDVVVDMGQVVDAIGSDADNQAEYIDERTRRDKKDENTDCKPIESYGKNSSNDVGDGENSPISRGTGDIDFLGSGIELLRNKYTIIDQQPLSDVDKASFWEGKYISATTNEDIKLYRTYGGGATQDGSYNGESPKEYLYLTTEKPTDRMLEKLEMALSNKWQGKRTNENGDPVFDKDGNQIVNLPNTREYFSEVIVPKGNIIHLGYVAPQETKGGQELTGGGVQIMAQNKGLWFGKEQKLNFASNYKKFDERAKRIEEDT